MTKQEITQELKNLETIRDRYTYESAEYNHYDNKIAALAEKLVDLEKAESPLVNNLQAERAWFNAQGFTAKDLQKANAACLKRGYSLAELQNAVKKSQQN